MHFILAYMDKLSKGQLTFVKKRTQKYSKQTQYYAHTFNPKAGHSLPFFVKFPKVSEYFEQIPRNHMWNQHKQGLYNGMFFVPAGVDDKKEHFTIPQVIFSHLRLAVANTQVDPPPPGPNELINDWELKYFNKEVMLSCVRDHSMNLSLLYESDDDYVDPENILAEPPPEMEDLDVDLEDVEMQPQPGLSGLGAAGPSTAGPTPMGPGGDVITDEMPLRTNRVRFDPLTDLVVRQYISSIPEPNQYQQHRAAAAYSATQQAITASPFAVQTQQPVCRTLYTQGISTVMQTTTPSTGQALTTTETAPTSPGGITTAVESLTITGEPLVPGMSTGGAQGAVGGTAVTPTVSPTKGKIGRAFDKLKQKFQRKDK